MTPRAQLSPSQERLFDHLVAAAGEFVPGPVLAELFPSYNCMKVTVHKLRKKLANDTMVLESVPWRGYRVRQLDETL